MSSFHIAKKIVHENNNREKWKLKTLKSRYKSFLEEEKQRADRNERLLQTLDRIDFQAASLAAKSGRLKMLKVSGSKRIFEIHRQYFRI